MQKMADNNINGSNYLTACLCKLQLPHTEEHVDIIPRQVMPTLQLSTQKFSSLDPKYEKESRVKDLLSDVDGARVKDLQLQRKFEKDAEELLRAYEAGEKCDHVIVQKLDESGAEESTARLKYELDHSRFQLAEVRNQIHSLKREMAAYEKLVRQEIGDNITLHEALTSDRWRGRAQDIKRLKTEIADMEAKAYDHKYLENPLCIPAYKPRFPDVNDLVPRHQVQVLENEARKKKQMREKAEKEINALIEQYGNVSLMYKASLTHNKMLAEELKSLKEQLSKYEMKEREDKDLMKNLIAHQMQMRQMIDREAHLARLVNRKQKEEKDFEKEEFLDAAKYQALWEASEREKCSLEKLVQMLTERLEGVIEIAEEAEKHCDENEKRRQELEQKIEAQKEAAKLPTKTKGAPKAGKPQSQPTAKHIPVASQLKAVKEENAYLRNFLLKAIETKVDDLKLYQFTMNSIRTQYVETLERLKSPPEAQAQQQL